MFIITTLELIAILEVGESGLKRNNFYLYDHYHEIIKLTCVFLYLSCCFDLKLGMNNKKHPVLLNYLLFILNIKPGFHFAHTYFGRAKWNFPKGKVKQGKVKQGKVEQGKVKHGKLKQCIGVKPVLYSK